MVVFKTMPVSWIPERLSHLRVDRRGIPVPFINAWGLETPERLIVEYDSSVGREAVFLDDSGEEEPDFTRQNMQRQRACMVNGLCQICGREVPWSRRFLVVSSISTQVVHVEGVECVVLVEPWLDEMCARLAVDRCPALIRRTRADDLTLVKITNKKSVHFVISEGWVEGPFEERTRTTPAVMWVKVVLPKGIIEISDQNLTAGRQVVARSPKSLNASTKPNHDQ